MHFTICQALMAHAGKPSSCQEVSVQHNRAVCALEGCSADCCLQGFAVRISHADLTGDGLLKAALEVLSNPKYAAAAGGVSVRLRTRKRTPVQEAIGAACSSLFHRIESLYSGCISDFLYMGTVCPCSLANFNLDQSLEIASMLPWQFSSSTHVHFMLKSVDSSFKPCAQS